MPACDFTPDWSKVWTKEVAEKEIQDFEFKGPGWYFARNGDTYLVLPTNDRLRFQFNFYTGRNPREHFHYIVSSAIQVDYRVDWS